MSLLLAGTINQKPSLVNLQTMFIHNSKIDILLSSPSTQIKNEIAELNKALDNISIQLIEKNSLNESDLMSLEPFNYNNIIILANESEDADPEKVDAEKYSNPIVTKKYI